MPPLQALGSRAFGLRCDGCGRSAPIVLVWRADDDESRRRAVVEAIDNAIGSGFFVSVSTGEEDEDVKVTKCLCLACKGTEAPS